MKKMLLLLVTVAFLALGTSAAFEKVNTYDNNFSDVKDTNWFSENVKSAYELGLMNGKSEGKFDPNGNVTVAEGITMAARVHAIYNNTEIVKKEDSGEFRIDFDDFSGISLNNATGEVADGMLVFKPEGPNSNGNYDLGVNINDLDLPAKSYSKMKVRMKRDELENINGGKRNETAEVFFQTSNDNSFGDARVVYQALPDVDLSEWFEFEIELSRGYYWKDTITRLRFDPTNNNGTYYIDWISLSKSEKAASLEKWYDMYVDYAKDNKIIKSDTFKSSDYDRNITRAELAALFAAALPEDYYAPINKVSGIPDMDKNDYYSDVVVMLYKAGIVLGSDKEGTFNPDSDIKRSEVAAIINRAALPENRINGEITSEWDGMYYAHDIEFEDEAVLDQLFLEDSETTIENGKLVLVPNFRENSLPKYDPKVGKINTLIKADEYSALKVRMKFDFEDENVQSMGGEFYFIPEGEENFGEAYSLRPNFDSNYYTDPCGWRVYTFNLFEKDTWTGNVTGFRFDPTNNAGTYTIDYIRFIGNESSKIISDEELKKNYTEKRLLDDVGFENGFSVMKVDSTKNELDGKWNYNESKEEPSWLLLPWWTKTSFFEDKDESADKYTLADKSEIKSVTYNPEEKSLTMRLNASKVYNGKPHIEGDMWPHLLVEQDFYNDDYNKVPEEEKARLDLGADKVYVEMDVRLNAYENLDAHNKGTENMISDCAFLVYFYVAHKEVPGLHTYFGIRPFHDGGARATTISWNKDSQSSKMIYSMPMDDTFGGLENAIWQADGNFPIGEWKKIRFDVTPHLENLCTLITKDNVLNRTVSRDDLWLSGVNAGFEIWGNYNCEVEMKNLNVIGYDKIEN